ncbi:hypothetical protein V6N13_114058 [Hibiscus sabdariffa]
MSKLPDQPRRMVQPSRRTAHPVDGEVSQPVPAPMVHFSSRFVHALLYGPIDHASSRHSKAIEQFQASIIPFPTEHKNLPFKAQCIS